MKLVYTKMQRCVLLGFFPLFLLPGILLPAYPKEVSSAETTALFSLYSIKEGERQEAKKLQQALVQEAPALEERALWEKLWAPLAPREKAALGLRLMEQIYPLRGDPGKWEEIRGFWHPSMHPRSLAGLDAFFVTLQALLEMEEPPASLLAYLLLKEFCTSSRARQIALREGPEIYGFLREELESQNLAPPGGWPRWKGKGTLPLARPVRGYVTVDTALARRMTFLDGYGGIASGLGRYAWDRETGRIYRVIYREDRRIFIPGSP